MAVTPSIIRRTLARGPRMEPSFLICGFAKCGTTSLFHALADHPDVCPPVKKEINYFNHNYWRGRAWYRRHFPYRWQAPHGRCITGEATPGYGSKSLAAQRIRRRYGNDVRLVLTLRDPVERAWSHYRHRIQRNEEELDFMSALDRELARRDKWRRGENVETTGWDWYVGGGCYPGKLRNIFWHFPRRQVHVLFFEELVADPHRELDRLAHFIGLAPAQMDLPKANAGIAGEMPEAARRRLENIFAPLDDETEAILGRRLPWR